MSKISKQEHHANAQKSFLHAATAGKDRDKHTRTHEVVHLFMYESDSIMLHGLASDEQTKPFENPEWRGDVFGERQLAFPYCIKYTTVCEARKKAEAFDNNTLQPRLFADNAVWKQERKRI